uniref:Uncharacterized protein n=1 Tax=Oryzias melastigma TaxID=30732 RepID=A0A3B3DNF8_ORYME
FFTSRSCARVGSAPDGNIAAVIRVRLHAHLLLDFLPASSASPPLSAPFYFPSLFAYWAVSAAKVTLGAGSGSLCDPLFHTLSSSQIHKCMLFLSAGEKLGHLGFHRIRALRL